MPQFKRRELIDSFQATDEEGKARVIEEWAEVHLTTFQDDTPPKRTLGLKSYRLAGSTTRLNRLEGGLFEVAGSGEVLRRVL